MVFVEKPFYDPVSVNNPLDFFLRMFSKHACIIVLLIVEFLISVHTLMLLFSTGSQSPNGHQTGLSMDMGGQMSSRGRMFRAKTKIAQVHYQTTSKYRSRYKHVKQKPQFSDFLSATKQH